MNTQFTISPDGARIAYDITGHGTALMLLHGAGQTRQDWHTLGYVERLKRDFTVITVDIRGSGQSEFLTHVDDYRIEKICADVNAVADACGVQQMAVWGFSFGGNIARYLGAWLERVKAIAIIGVPFGPAVDDEFDHYIDEFLEEYGAVAAAYQTGKLTEAKRESVIKEHIPVWVACFQAMRAWPILDPDALRCSTMLLAGTQNTGVAKWIKSNRLALEKANIQVEIIEGLEHPQEFSQVEKVYPVVNSFLKKSLSVV